MSRLTRILTMTLGSVLLFALFAVAGWAITDRLTSEDQAAMMRQAITEVPIVPAQSIDPPPQVIEVLVSPEGDPPEGVEAGADGSTDFPTTNESNFDDVFPPHGGDGPRVAGFLTDTFPTDPVPDGSEPVVADPAVDPVPGPDIPIFPDGIVPIPDVPGPVGPGASDEDGTSFVPLLEDFDPWDFAVPVPLLIDPCAAAAGSDDGSCVPGIGGTIVPIFNEALEVFDFTSDVGGRCDGQFLSVPRDSFGIAISSNRPGVFDVTSQPSRAGAPPDRAIVSTPDSQVARWTADESVTVTTCVALDRAFRDEAAALDRAFSDGPTVEETRYRVTVIGTDPAAIPPSMVEKFVTVPPTGRPEVVIAPAGDRSFTMWVPARSSEDVIVAVLPQDRLVADVCSTFDVSFWRWPTGSAALGPVSRERIEGVSPFGDADPSFDTRYVFAATVDSGEPFALCVLWFSDFEPTPEVTERQSFAINPPTRPRAVISLFSVSDGRVSDGVTPSGDRIGLAAEARTGVDWTVNDASGALLCNFRIYRINNAAEVPSGPCEFDVVRGGGVVPITLTGLYRRSGRGGLATSEEDDGYAYEAPPTVRALDLDSYRCSEPTCRAVVPITINGPNELGWQYVLATAGFLIEITNGGSYGGDWSIQPTGPFTAEGEPPPEFPQLNYASSSITLDPQLPAAVLVVEWETDRPALVSASWKSDGQLTTGVAPGASRGDPMSCGAGPPWGTNPGSGRFETQGRMELIVGCPGLEYDVNLRVEGEDGAVVAYGESTPVPGAILYPWIDANNVETERLPILLEWRTRNEGSFRFQDLATEIGFLGGVSPYEFRERRTSWLNRPACGPLPGYDTSSDGPIRLEVTAEMLIEYTNKRWLWFACDPVGGAVEAAPFNPRVHVYTNPFTGGIGSVVSVWDELQKNEPLVFLVQPSRCYREYCADDSRYYFHELTVTIRLEDEAYRSLLLDP